MVYRRAGPRPSLIQGQSNPFPMKTLSSPYLFSFTSVNNKDLRSCFEFPYGGSYPRTFIHLAPTQLWTISLFHSSSWGLFSLFVYFFVFS